MDKQDTSSSEQHTFQDILLELMVTNECLQKIEKNEQSIVQQLTFNRVENSRHLEALRATIENSVQQDMSGEKLNAEGLSSATAANKLDEIVAALSWQSNVLDAGFGSLGAKMDSLDRGLSTIIEMMSEARLQKLEDDREAKLAARKNVAPPVLTGKAQSGQQPVGSGTGILSGIPLVSPIINAATGAIKKLVDAVTQTIKPAIGGFAVGLLEAGGSFFSEYGKILRESTANLAKGVGERVGALAESGKAAVEGITGEVKELTKVAKESFSRTKAGEAVSRVTKAVSSAVPESVKAAVSEFRETATLEARARVRLAEPTVMKGVEAFRGVGQTIGKGADAALKFGDATAEKLGTKLGKSAMSTKAGRAGVTAGKGAFGGLLLYSLYKDMEEVKDRTEEMLDTVLKSGRDITGSDIANVARENIAQTVVPNWLPTVGGLPPGLLDVGVKGIGRLAAPLAGALGDGGTDVKMTKIHADAGYLSKTATGVTKRAFSAAEDVMTTYFQTWEDISQDLAKSEAKGEGRVKTMFKGFFKQTIGASIDALNIAVGDALESVTGKTRITESLTGSNVRGMFGGTTTAITPSGTRGKLSDEISDQVIKLNDAADQLLNTLAMAEFKKRQSAGVSPLESATKQIRGFTQEAILAGKEAFGNTAVGSLISGDTSRTSLGAQMMAMQSDTADQLTLNQMVPFAMPMPSPQVSAPAQNTVINNTVSTGTPERTPMYVTPTSLWYGHP